MPYILVVFAYLGCQRVYGAVHSNGIGTASVGTPFFGVSDVRIHRHFRSYLLPFGIYADLAQKLACPVFTDFCPIDVEEYGECAASFRCIVVLILFHDYLGLWLLNGDSETRGYPAVKVLCVCPDFVIGHFRVDLRRSNPVMPQHTADGLKRHAMRKRDFSSVGMAAAVIDQSALDTADFGNPFQICVQGGIAIHR